MPRVPTLGRLRQEDSELEAKMEKIINIAKLKRPIEICE